MSRTAKLLRSTSEMQGACYSACLSHTYSQLLATTFPLDDRLIPTTLHKR